MTLRCQLRQSGVGSDPRIISCFQDYELFPLDLFPRVSCLTASSLSTIINFFCGPCRGLLFFYSSCLLQGEGNFPLPVGFLNVAVPEICFSVSSSAVLLWILSILAGRQGHKMHNCLKFLKLASWPWSQWHLQLFNYIHMPLSSYIMLSNKSKCTFFPLEAIWNTKHLY